MDTQRKILAMYFLIIGAIPLWSQADTEVYLMKLRQSSDGPVIEKPENISNNQGYDNQPSFWGDGESLLYARTVNWQTEIARYYPGSGNTMIVSKTLQGSEYSPTPMPDGRISSIRLDTTGLQLLYAYKMDGSHEVLVPEAKIGYHAWIDENKLAAFVLGEPPSLALINTQKKETKTIAHQIGRSLHKVPGQNKISYVDKAEEPWVIKTFDVTTAQTEELIRTVDNSEDYCWTPKNQLIMGSGSKLYWWTKGGEWKPFADLQVLGIKKITRLAISPDGKRLALVGE